MVAALWLLCGLRASSSYLTRGVPGCGCYGMAGVVVYCLVLLPDQGCVPGCGCCVVVVVRVKGLVLPPGQVLFQSFAPLFVLSEIVNWINLHNLKCRNLQWSAFISL